MIVMLINLLHHCLYKLGITVLELPVSKYGNQCMLTCAYTVKTGQTGLTCLITCTII